MGFYQTGLVPVWYRESIHASRSGIPLSTLLIDVDKFKQINDTWGHNTGDEILRKVAGAFYDNVRTGLLSRLAHIQEGDSADIPPLTLLPDDPLTPGISHFEQLLRHLIVQIMPSIRRRYPSGSLQIIVQTNGIDKDRESQSFHRIWSAGSPPWKVEIHFQDAGSSLDDWNQFVGSTKRPVLILAMHYRQPDDILPEFATALFLKHPSMLNPGEQKMRYGFSGRCRSTSVCLQRNRLSRADRR